MPEGTVSRYDADKGFGFITPDEGGPDLFVHFSQVSGERLAQGQRVEFVAAPGKKGMQATQVRALGSSSRAEPAQLMTGTVSWFDDERGFGFLLPEGGGADVFVHVSELSGSSTLVPGQPVQFQVVPGPRGPQARSVFVLSSSGSREVVAQRAQGTMSWFNADKGFGFLVPDDGGGDVFVHVSQIAEDGAFIDEGERVEFDVVAGERGRQAHAVRVVGGSAPASAPAPRPRSRSGSFGRALGTVAWFDDDKGFGFLSADDAAGDVFVHASSIADGRTLREGQRVDFEIVPGERGRTAEDVRPA